MGYNITVAVPRLRFFGLELRRCGEPQAVKWGGGGGGGAGVGGGWGGGRGVIVKEKYTSQFSVGMGGWSPIQ